MLSKKDGRRPSFKKIRQAIKRWGGSDDKRGKDPKPIFQREDVIEKGLPKATFQKDEASNQKDGEAPMTREARDPKRGMASQADLPTGRCY